MKKLIVSNWKMLPNTWAEAEQILDFVNDHLESGISLGESSLVFCPPFVFLEEVGKILKESHLEDISFLGAQDIAVADVPNQTGEVSGEMLIKLGVQYVIIGHSERRWKLGESNETVNQKLKIALVHELMPIVCLGEKERNDNFKEFLKEQTLKTFEGLNEDEMGKCIITYEPVWAISTNPGARPDTPESALESIRIIKDTLATRYSLLTTRYLYGGSVNSKNVYDFIKQKEINGVLVGGASVNKEEFVKMLKIISRL